MRFSLLLLRWKIRVRSFGHLIWKGTPEETAKPVPQWFHLPVQAISAGLLLYWYWNLPLPNKAVLVLAAVAALMVLAEMRPIHKAIYVVLIIALVATENRAINHDRWKFEQDEAARRAEENAQFGDIAGGLKTAIKQGQDQFGQTMQQFNENVKTVMGGDTFCYLVMTMVLIPKIVVEGKYPLRGVQMEVRDLNAGLRVATQLKRLPTLDEIMSTEQDFKLGDLAPYHQEPIYPIPEILQQRDERDLEVIFVAFNGSWSEHICMRLATNNVPQGTLLAGAFTVKRQGRILFHNVDQTYPKGQTCN